MYREFNLILELNFVEYTIKGNYNLMDSFYLSILIDLINDLQIVLHL